MKKRRGTFEAMLSTGARLFAKDVAATPRTPKPRASDYRQMGSQALAQAIARGADWIAQLILRHLQPPKVSVGAERGFTSNAKVSRDSADPGLRCDASADEPSIKIC